MTELNEIEEIEQSSNPWNNAPEGVVFYKEIKDDGEIIGFTIGAELAYKIGLDLNNYLNPEDVQQSNKDFKYYLKDKCPVKGVQEFRREKLNELAAVANKFEQIKCSEMFVTSSLGFRVNADRRSVQNIENLIRIGETTDLKDYDNQFQTVTVEDLETILIEVSKNGANLYKQKFTMQQQIASLTTSEEIQDFEIQFSMLDFSQA